MRVWITKYAMTQGILEAEARSCEPMYPGMIRVGVSYFHGNDWHNTLGSAQDRVELMLGKRLASLKKQLEEFGKLRSKAHTVRAKS